jgi:anaerobic ribonucleoside-triphosphate reductase activating protein
MRIGINKMHYPVTTLGYGGRIGIWMQGCTIHCPGCVSKDTWAFDPGMETVVAEVMSGLMPWLADADGLTVSGGEPFDQPEALSELLRCVRPVLNGDILVYSGYALSSLMSRHAELLANVDVLISGPFDPDAGQTLALRGSDNQRISLFTPLAESRYTSGIDKLPWQGKRHFDMVIDGDALWLAGIPELGAMDRFREELSARGLSYATSDQSVPMVRA